MEILQLNFATGLTHLKNLKVYFLAKLDYFHLLLEALWYWDTDCTYHQNFCKLRQASYHP